MKNNKRGDEKREEKLCNQSYTNKLLLCKSHVRDEPRVSTLCVFRLITHTQQQTLVLLDGTHAAQEACHHDDGAQDDDQIGS